MVSGEEHLEERTPEERTARPKEVDEFRKHGGGWGRGWRWAAGQTRWVLAAPKGLWPHAG